MNEHIEEIAFLSSLLTIVAARIESLKLRHGTEALAAQVQQLKQELQKLKNIEVKE